MPNPNDPALTPPNPFPAPVTQADPDSKAVSEAAEKIIMAERVARRISEAAAKQGITREELCRRAAMQMGEMEKMVEKSIKADDEAIAERSKACADPQKMNRDITICSIKRMRRGLDHILQEIKTAEFNQSVLRLANHGHRSDANMALWEAELKTKEAIMWLGMLMKALNDGVSCYKEGYDPTSPKVEPTPDGIKM